MMQWLPCLLGLCFPFLCNPQWAIHGLDDCFGSQYDVQISVSRKEMASGASFLYGHILEVKYSIHQGVDVI